MRALTRRSLCALALLAALACGDDPRDVAADSEVCSDWPNRLPSTWPSDTLLLPEDVLSAGGIALSHANAFVLDLSLGRVVRLDSMARIVATFGRSGDGPGELARAHSTSIAFLTSPEWIAIRSESLFVFDGRSVHLLATDGTQLALWKVAASAGAGISTKMRPLGLGVVVDLHRGFDPSDGLRGIRPNRSFSLLRVRPESTQVLATFRLSPAPLTTQGMIFEGPAEARPQWDVVGRCVVVMDGSTPTLTLIDAETGSRATRVVPLPDRFFDFAQANAQARFEGMSGGPMPAPTLPKRISALMLDHAGWIWMRPTPPEPRPGWGVEVWRYHIPTGRFTIDTVAAYSRLLSASGGVVGLATDRELRTRVIPIDR